MTVLRTATFELEKVSGRQQVFDYLMLAKPRVVVMVLAVTMAGFYMGTVGTPHWASLFHLLVGVAFAAGGTLALNQYLERDENALMQRTQSRPLPDGRMQPFPALCFGVGITVGGLLYLTVMVHALAGFVTALTACSYLFLGTRH